jgi:CubicO group peptidase (beta-lactamase class C family)
LEATVRERARPLGTFQPAAARRLLRDAVAQRACPAVVVETGDRRGPVWREAFGALTYEPDAPAASLDTVFDLASLTKVVATTTLVMRAVDAHRLTLDDRVGAWLRAWRGADREPVTLRDLLAHCAGLTSYVPLYRDCRGRAEFEATICELPLEYPPRTQAVYSDLGFMLLGFILEDATGTSLASQFADIAALVAPEPLGFAPPRSWRPRIAPTEVDPWRGRLLVGEVHDENAWALGGVAGHAGLFGTVGAVGGFARLVLETLRADTALARRATLEAFLRPTDVPGSSRALGWDTMRPTASCGRRLSPRAVGHTGFTGTSLWIDPARDLYVVVLSNRVHPTRENDAFKVLRPQIHDAILEGWGFGPGQAAPTTVFMA